MIDAVQIPIKSTIPLYDDAQFPPVAVLAAEWQSHQHQQQHGPDGTASNTKGNKGSKQIYVIETF